MTSGRPLTSEQKEYIIDNKDTKFINEMSKDLGLNRKTIRLFLNKN